MIRTLILSALLMFGYAQAHAFCGFYVAKADATLFNQTSQVIMVRDGNQTIVTMASDFKGDVKDFAMVVPVPSVLKRSDIRVMAPQILRKIDDYSSPRLVEYHDPKPCYRQLPGHAMATMELSAVNVMSAPSRGLRRKKKKKSTVKIQAKYKVEEYDVIILSSKKSEDLETWLVDHGYKVPDNAKEALRPYIKSGMKFFVVKVDMSKYKQGQFAQLRPLQIKFKSNRFMLPIRLGMANAESVQDMIVYTFTRKGRVETSNYRTVKVPSNREIPTFIKNQNKFGDFYASVFKKCYNDEGQNGVFLEYSWDL
ncbi:MAG: DUF2330 domain-containing protein, partial [Bacteroidota bacterium]